MQASSLSTVPSTKPTPIPTGDDELPPLPADVSSSAGQSRFGADPIPVTKSDGAVPVRDSTTAEDLPALSGGISSQVASADSARAAIAMPDAAQAPLDPAPVTIRNPAVALPRLAQEVSSPNPNGYKEERALSPLPADAEKRSDTVPPSVITQPLGTAELSRGPTTGSVRYRYRGDSRIREPQCSRPKSRTSTRFACQPARLSQHCRRISTSTDE